MTNTTTIPAPIRAFELGTFETILLHPKTMERLKFANRDNDRKIQPQDTYDSLINALLDKVEQSSK